MIDRKKFGISEGNSTLDLITTMHRSYSAADEVEMKFLWLELGSIDDDISEEENLEVSDTLTEQ